MANDFWDRVLAAFRDAGMDTAQNAIAATLGVTQGAVSKWARGSGHPTLKKCIRIAELTHTNVEWLLTGSGNKEQERSMDEITQQLLKTWAELPMSARKEFLEYLTFRAQKAKSADGPAESGPNGPRTNHH